MQPFLKLVAHDLYEKIGSDLSRTVLVFPNKRAYLFFNQYLADESDKPIWSPAMLSISDLFRRLSDLKAGDPIRLVCELYRIFVEETRSEESLDDFFFWGEMLVSDFDDIDKNLVDADKLLGNLKDLKNIMDDYDFLDPEQEEAIQQFFQNFSIEHRTELKEKFISLWNCLGTIYRRYRERLAELGIAYEGMLYRRVIEQFHTDELKYDHYVFVGFNVLNKVEHRFFQQLQDAGKALFYWDYDVFYTEVVPHHEAGTFLLRNLSEFPNQLSKEHFDVMRRPKQVRYLSAPTENAQARYLTEWTREVARSGCPERENAVVLCNETLLQPVLHSLPPEVKYVNVTMGFPLAQTPIFSFVNAAIDLQTSGYRAQEGRFTFEMVAAVLNHPYTRQLSSLAETLVNELTRINRFYPYPSELQKDEFLTYLFTPRQGTLELSQYLMELIRQVSVLYRPTKESSSAKDEKDKEVKEENLFNQLYQESLFRCYTTVNRLYSLMETGDLDIRTDTLRRLLNKLLSATNIPFHGEPAIGMQVMGVLETRNLDFRNLILLSLNEGKLPQASGESSFIPYHLRKAFGMTTLEHKNAVYAYYFYRLIQRAETVTLLYNTSSEGLNNAEWSRFMLQFLLESPHTIHREYLEAGQSPTHNRGISVEKTPAILERMYQRYDSRKPSSILLSPSAINMYLDCSLKFYFRYIAGLKPKEEVTAEIDSALFGTLFHRSAELVYQDLTAHTKMIQREDLEKLLDDEPRLQNYVDRAFKEEFFQVPLHEKPEYNGTQLIHSKVILSYLKQLLRNDLRYAPFQMNAMEYHTEETMLVPTVDGPIPVRIGGTIDRMDTKGNILRIVDYKTGGSPLVPNGIDDLFKENEKRPNYIFQTFLYASIINQKQRERAASNPSAPALLQIAPSLLYIHQAASEEYSPVIQMGSKREGLVDINDFSKVEDDFRNLLQETLENLFYPDKPFTQTTIEKKCQYCDFKSFCGK